MKMEVSSGGEEHDEKVIRADWGLGHAIYRAYNSHHELRLRPDDVWQAILTQFSFYLNGKGRPEKLRKSIVKFEEGTKSIVCMDALTIEKKWGLCPRIHYHNIDKAIVRMVDEKIEGHLKDLSYKQWLLPDFTTTDINDRVAASISVMGTLRAYFPTEISAQCGLPRVTLLGKKDDWQALRLKVNRFTEFDTQEGLMAKWQKLLVAVLDHFVSVAEGEEPDEDFWYKSIDWHQGSGFRFLTGWATVFNVFQCDGQWREADQSELTAEQRMTEWPALNMTEISAALVTLPVEITKKGKKVAEANMFAGQFAVNAIDGGRAIQPRTDWAIATVVKK